jgi:hypothetical protein
MHFLRFREDESPDASQVLLVHSFARPIYVGGPDLELTERKCLAHPEMVIHPDVCYDLISNMNLKTFALLVVGIKSLRRPWRYIVLSLWS